MNRSSRILLIIVPVLLLGSSCSSASRVTPPTSHADTIANQPQGGRSVRLPDGRSQFIACRGIRAPTVVFESGLHDDSTQWSSLVDTVSRTHRACRYDRAGLGASDAAAPTPRGLRRMSDDLLTTLNAAHEAGPFVLVGHSYGGLIVADFAAHRRSKVAGIVLVDSSTPGQIALQQQLFPAAVWQQIQAFLQDGPDGVEVAATAAESAQLTVGSLGSIPTTVLTAGLADDGLDVLSDAVRAEYLRQVTDQRGALARLSSASRSVTVTGASHYIQRDNPAAVINAIKAVVRPG